MTQISAGRKIKERPTSNEGPTSKNGLTNKGGLMTAPVEKVTTRHVQQESTGRKLHQKLRPLPFFRGGG